MDHLGSVNINQRIFGSIDKIYYKIDRISSVTALEWSSVKDIKENQMICVFR